MKLFKIKPNLSGELRTKLCVEDVEFKDIQVLLELKLIEAANTYWGDSTEELYFFREPFRVPKFNYLYGSKIKGVNDPYLTEAIQGFLYLNPSPNLFIKRKIAEYIVVHFSATSLQESDVSGQMIHKAILTFEQVLGHINSVVSTGVMPYWEPDTQEYVMYSNRSSLSGVDKRRIKNEYRRSKITTQFENAIHDATEFLIEEESLLKITTSRIQSTNKIVTVKGVASKQTISKYMSDRTKRVLDRHNGWAPFKSEVTYQKYNQYLLTCDASSSLEDIVYATNVSKSTAVEFKKVRYGQ